MRHLLAHATQLGVSVHVAHLPAPFRGFYDHENSRVIYGFDLTPIERRCVLAHELGHVYYGHVGHGVDDYEEAADLYAARLLIDPRELARSFRHHSGLDEVAESLGVERRLLDVYLRSDVRRLGHRTYVRARLGAGQYAHSE